MTGGANLRSNPQCHPPDLSPSQVPLVGDITFHHGVIYVGTIVAGLSVLISAGHVLHHAFNCYRVSEQKFLMRVILVLPAFAVFYTLGSWWYPSMQYLATIPEIVEAVALVSLFQLFVEQAAGSTDRYEQETYFANLERHKRKKLWEMFSNKKGGEVRHEKGSLRWYRVICLCLYQFPVVKALWTPLYIALVAVACPKSTLGTGVQFLKGLINALTTGAALWALIIFYSRLRPILKPNHAFRKAFVLKKMIGIVLAQTVIMSLVEGANGIHPTAQMSYGDYTVGVLAFMTQVEMFFFAIGFIFCYNVKEYKDIHKFNDQEGGAMNKQANLQPTVGRAGKVSSLRAIWAMINISDLASNIWRSAKFIFQVNRKEYSVGGIPANKMSPISSLGSTAPPTNAPAAMPPAHPFPNQVSSASHPGFQQEYGVTQAPTHAPVPQPPPNTHFDNSYPAPPRQEYNPYPGPPRQEHESYPAPAQLDNGYRY